ncbi:NAD(P)/FAD-dependent oxidoreductase [Hirschia baltica]|uniref:Amine oxidase n=1 Tax=Hirschia baltica (strain ATCC 49814 / DSM 5838 / IFAM 1418) TaxID=582402 RepID=C6XIS0_HIRBI|nr:FAD-dependent oxidoreductase [Hirschia baltica]ACT59015.1 amine oxidase [Hirschia baltica ATCC 49814]
MAYDTTKPQKPTSSKNIAIIGGGISGLGAAWKLSQNHNVTLFESEAELGGHARTRMAGPNRDIPVDTGFMVFNDATYPNLIDLFKTLNIASTQTSMSFAVSLDDGAFEYGLSNLGRVFADPKNAISPKFIGMLRDILKFNKQATTQTLDPNLTLKELLDNVGVGEYFRQRYLYPLAGAIWSTARQDMESFPAQSFVRFFENHGLLSAHNGPKWRTVIGGSKTYVDKLHAALEANQVIIKTHTPIAATGRSPQPWIKTESGETERFDEIVFACHSDQALKIASDSTQQENNILSALRYRPNKVYLHGDTSQMPLRKSAWSCWVYRGDTNANETNGSFTYWMNQLQHISGETPVFVTLNPKQPINEDLIYDETELWHPQFDVKALNAQNQLASIQGTNNYWFCGAYTRYGFHEDGLISGLNVAQSIQAASAIEVT